MPSLVSVLLAEVSRLISMRSYVKIVAADTSYSDEGKLRHKVNLRRKRGCEQSCVGLAMT